MQRYFSDFLIILPPYTLKVVAGGFIYVKEEHKFLVLYHKDLKMFLYSGGHVNDNGKSPLQTAKREIMEETGLSNLEQLKLSENEKIPIDIDTYLIEIQCKIKLTSTLSLLF